MEIEHRSPTVEEYLKLRELVGWWKTDKGATEKAINNSLFAVVATENGTVIGTGRIAGDGGLYFYIQDLIVHPDFQLRGVGNAMMKALMVYIKTNAQPGSFIALMAAKGLEKYYREFGFAARDPDAPGMYLVLK